jgi:hypothetical protein
MLCLTSFCICEQRKLIKLLNPRDEGGLKLNRWLYCN